MSLLRLCAVATGLVMIGVSFYRLRRYAEKRTGVWLSFLIGFLMMVVGFFPAVLNVPTDLLLVSRGERGRILTLILISLGLSWFLLLYERSKSILFHQQFVNLAGNLAVKSFLKEHSGKIAPETVLVLIPAYNEEENLTELLPKIPKRVNGSAVTALVIDDGSTDGTAEVAGKFGMLTAEAMTNRGQGAALKIGYNIARHFNVFSVVTMDADGQHNPDEIESLVAPILADEADLVIGSRVIGSSEKYSGLRYAGVNIFNKVINVMLGTHITDCSSGFRAIRGEVLNSCLLTQEQYQAPEIIIEAAKRGFRISERPVNIISRFKGKSKKGHSIKYGAFFLRTILKTWWR